VNLLLAILIAASGTTNLKRARDRFEFGAYSDCAGAIRAFLADHPEPSDRDAIDAYRMLGLSEFHLGDRRQARAAFVNLLSRDPDYELDPFLVPPQIVEFFDNVKRENEPQLAPLRERRRQLKEQQRLAEEARRKLLAEEQARSGAPTKVIRVEERLYLLNWMPLGAGQFQNGHKGKGTAIAAGQLASAALNIGAIIFHSQIVDDRSRRCTSSQCGHPPFTDSDRSMLTKADIIKYVSAGLFWAIYAYGVIDAHKYYVPRIETEITEEIQPGKVSLAF
jgi:hypothetical protein